MSDSIPSWPKVTIKLYDDHNGEVKIAGQNFPLVDADARAAAVALVAERAAQLGRPVRATAVEADGNTWPLIIHPDGIVDALDVEVKGRKPLWPILVATTVALMLVAGTLVYLLVLREPTAAPTTTVSPTLPGLPPPQIKADVFDARPIPPGWSKTAPWTLDIAEDTTPAVSPDGLKVAVITRDQKICVLDPAGKVLWQDKVPDDFESPVFTTIDGVPVVAVRAPESLTYWSLKVNGTLPVKVELPAGAEVNFFGSSPMVTVADLHYVVAGAELKEVPAGPRRATPLLADGQRVLFARYFGPLSWSEPGKAVLEVVPKPPKGATKIERVLLASPGRAIVLWSTAKANTVIPSVHATSTGSPLATCPASDTSAAAESAWVIDPAGKFAALGECVISFASGKSRTVPEMRPVGIVGDRIYAEVDGQPRSVNPAGGTPAPLTSDVIRPWGIAGQNAIVLHENVLYALAPVKK